MGKKPAPKTILGRKPAKVVSRSEKDPVRLTKKPNENYSSSASEEDDKKSAFNSGNGKTGHDPDSRNTRSTKRSGDSNVSTEQDIVVASASKQHTEPTPLVSNASVSGKKRAHEKTIDSGVAAQKNLHLEDSDHIPASVLNKNTKGTNMDAPSVSSKESAIDDDDLSSYSDKRSGKRSSYDYLPSEVVDKMDEETKDDIWRRFKLLTDTNINILAVQMMKKHGYKDIEAYSNEFNNVRDLIKNKLNYKRAFSQSKLKTELRREYQTCFYC